VPVAADGHSLEFLGAFVRVIPADTLAGTYTGGIASARGFPPKVTESHHPVAGFTVTRLCEYSDPNAPQPGAMAELDVGAGKPAHFTGGGWTGFTVTYRVGSTEYVVTWDTGLYACGPGTPALTSCGTPD